MQIFFTYPSYLVIVALLVSLGISALLYSGNSVFSKQLNWLLFILRAATVFIILLLLLNPLLKQFQRIIIKPTIIFAQDNSESMIMGKDSSYLKIAYQKSLQDFKQKISNKANLIFLTFGQQITKQDNFNFREKTTNFDALFRFISQNYQNNNLAAVIVSSDGLMNHGKNPLYEIYSIKAPVHCFANGDTTTHKDIAISDVIYNSIVLVDNPYPIEVKIKATLANGTETQLHIYDNEQQVAQQKIKINESFFYISIPFMLTSSGKQIHTIKIVADPLSGEKNLRNNQMELKIEVIDARQKILIIANSPHPDIALISEALESNLNFEVTSILANELNPNTLKDYNLIILHALPSLTHSLTNAFEKIRQLNLPVWYIVGTQTDLTKLNNIQSFIQISQQKGLWDNATPTLYENFEIFTVPDDINDFLADMPPLKVPFGDYKILADKNIVLTQKIKNIDTSKPLLILFNDQTHKAGFLIGENIWRWGIYDYKDFDTKDHIYHLINNVAQYLSLKINKNNLIINIKPIYDENENINIIAEFYNEIFEKTNEADLEMKITHKKTNSTYTYNFLKTENDYSLNIGNIPIGDYQYEAITKYQKKTYSKSGSFTIQASQLEQVSTQADFSFLSQLSEKFSGHFFYPKQWQSLTDTILSQKNLISISKSKEKIKNLIDWKLIFFIIIGFITIEWFLRKYYGSR